MLCDPQFVPDYEFISNLIKLEQASNYLGLTDSELVVAKCNELMLVILSTRYGKQQELTNEFKGM